MPTEGRAGDAVSRLRVFLRHETTCTVAVSADPVSPRCTCGLRDILDAEGYVLYERTPDGMVTTFVEPKR